MKKTLSLEKIHQIRCEKGEYNIENIDIIIDMFQDEMEDRVLYPIQDVAKRLSISTQLSGTLCRIGKRIKYVYVEKEKVTSR